jgi:hypothetical protein
MLRFLGDASPSASYKSTEVGLWILAVVTVPVAGFSCLLVRDCIRAESVEGRSRWELASSWVAAATACLWVLFFTYWTWGPLLRS